MICKCSNQIVSTDLCYILSDWQEAELYSVYNKALENVRQGETQHAIQRFKRLLDHQLIKQVIEY